MVTGEVLARESPVCAARLKVETDLLTSNGTKTIVRVVDGY
jgi:hypothetical protein